MKLFLMNSLSFFVIIIYFVSFPKFSFGFECKHNNINLTALSGTWQSWTDDSVSENISYTISLCSALKPNGPGSNTCSPGTSICMRYNATTSLSAGNFNASAPELTGGTNDEQGESWIVLAGDPCPTDDVYNLTTSINFKCGPTLGSPVFLDFATCVSYFEWETNLYCKTKNTKKEVKCYMYDDSGKRYDLSPLAKRKGGYLVSSELDTDIYINVCRDIEPDPLTTGCPTTHAACKKSNGVFMGLGEATEDLKRGADGRLMLKYVSPDSEAASGCTEKPSTTILFICPDRGVSKDPLVVEDYNCQYVIEWETEYACSEEKLHNDSCVLTKQDADIDIDLRPLKRPPGNVYKVSWADPSSSKGTIYDFFLNVCDGAHVPCPDNAHEARIPACQLIKANTHFGHAMGSTDHTKLTYADGKLTLTYKGGEKCQHNNFQRQTVINFVCNQTAGDGNPVFENEDDCVYIFSWPTKYACLDHPAEESCRVDVGDKKYDLGPLSRRAGVNWMALHEQNDLFGSGQYFINVCHNILQTGDASRCDPGSAICYREGLSTRNLGRYENKPVMDSKTNSAVITYTNGDICPGKTSLRISSNITFICKPGEGDSAPYLTRASDDKCFYEFEWKTAAACSLGHYAGKDCKIYSDGLSFDLTPLRLATSSYQVDSPSDSGHDYYLNVCGPVTDHCQDLDIQNVGICQVPKDGTGDSYVTGQWASSLRYYDGMINLTYTGGTPYNDDNHTKRKSEIAFICDLGAGNGKPQFLAELASEHYYAFEWRTSYACPIEAMQCTAEDDNLNQQYDLSSLTLTGDNNWAVDSSSNTKYYINICQPLNKVAVGNGCDPFAAVCRTKFENGQEKVDIANMGKVGSRITVESKGKLRLVYKGGICNNGTANVTYITNIELMCRHNTLTSPPSAPFQDGPCEYTILWDTPAACPLQKDKDLEPCTAKDPNSDYVFNLSPLKKPEDHPWNITVDGSNYLINICGNISESICKGGDSNQYGVCVQKGDDTHGIAEAKTQLDFTEFGAMSMLYEGARLDNGLRIDVMLVFVCEPGKDLGYPTFEGKKGDMYVFNVFTALACTPISTDCLVQDETGKQYNLRPLTIDGFYAVTDSRDDNTKYYINVCSPVQNVTGGDCLDGPIGGCQVASNGKSFNMGYIQSKPIAQKDGTLTMHYRNGDVCHKGTDNEAHRSTRINFFCSDVEGTPVFGYETQTCEYVFNWRTPAACPIQSNTGHQCKVVDPLYNHQFDLSALGSFDYSVTVGDDRYLISACGQLQDTTKCGPNSGTGVCVTKPKDTNFHPIIAGKANDKLIYDGGDLLLNYTGGDNNCHVIIKFSCDLKHEGGDGPQFVEKSEQNCRYLFDWPTNHACPPRMSASCNVRDTDGKSYDLTDLGLLNDNYEVTDTVEKKRYILNVCRSIIYKKNATCPYTSAACMVDLTKPDTSPDKYKSIGKPTGYQMKFENGQIVIEYTNGDKCSNGKDNMTTHITFKCDKNAHHSSPAGHFMVGDCDHHFLWTTSLACPLTDNSDGGGDSDVTCKVKNPATGSVFDLSVLTSRTTPYSVKDKNNNIYQFNICSSLLNSSCADAKKNSIGVCQSPPAGSDRPSYNAGKAIHNPWFDDGIVILNLTGGEPCHKKQYERNTIITFVCNRHRGIGRPVFVDETEDCTYYISWHTNLVCEEELKCSVDTDDYRTIDLSPLAQNPDQVVHSTEDGSIFYLSLCSSLTPTTGLLCPAGSGVCQVKPTDGVNHISLGKPKKAPTYDKGNKDIILTYVNGSKCDTDPSKNFSSRVIFSCLPGPVRSSPRFVRKVDCEFVFQWDTYTVCTETTDTACGYHDNTGDFYDFKSLQSDVPTEVKVGIETKYLINMCGGIKSDDTSSCDSQMVCRKEDGLSFGKPSNYKVVKEGQYLKMTYDSGGATCKGDRKAESSIQFVCDRTVDQGAPIVLASMDCSVVFEWATSYVCPTKQNPCSVVIDNYLYDLSILSKIRGAWNVTDKDKNTYWINVCTAAMGPKLPKGCGETAASCRVSKDKTAGEVLGLINAQKNIYKNSDTGALVLEYENGNACEKKSETASTTKINFICGTTFGAPVFVESDQNKETCIYEFNWKTKFACKVESESLQMSKGVITDKKSGLMADLRPIWNTSIDVVQKLDSGNENVYSILLNGSSTKCTNGVICEIKNKNIYRTLGTFASAKFTEDDWVIEATYSTPQKCSGDESSHNVTSTIQFICSKKEMPPKLLYSKKDCFFMFTWESSHACLYAKDLVPAGGSGNQGTGTSSSNKSGKGGGVSTSTVVGIVATFLGAIVLCILLVVFHRQERREACFQRVRGLFPRGRSEYSQLPTGAVDDIFGDEEEVVTVQDAAGDDEEEDPIITVTTTPASYHDDSDEDLLA